jgi:hypothetical protein
MKNIRTAILAVCLGMLSSIAAQAQQNFNFNEGDDSLSHDNNGSFNEAVGLGTLEYNYNGGYNSAFGAFTLGGAQTGTPGSTSGSHNSAFGMSALGLETSGWENSAFGFWALFNNTAGASNSAFGNEALYSNNLGNQNTAVGDMSLLQNTTGDYNTALGAWALGGNNALGNYNVGIGYAAGYNLPAGATNNVDILSWGPADDNNTIRIGNSTHTAFYAAGVFGTLASGGTEVYINSDGLLGTRNSSIRFKEDVHDMAAASDGLMRLRPVTYRYKQPYTDGSKPIDYGLIAEEVVEVYPDLVVKDADGQIQTVQYQKLTPMLLNEVQKEHKLLEQQGKTIELLEKRLAALEAAQPSAALEARLATK